MCPLLPVFCCFFLYSISKMPVFMPLASAMIVVHRNRLVLASIAQQPEIQPLVSQDQIISAKFPQWMDRQL